MSATPSTAQLRALSHEAIDATSTAYTEDAAVDVEQRLVAELADRGIEVDDDEWVRQVARAIRSGHGVQLDPPPPTAPGSLGGDNGGG
ncbi:MAG TPA: hypothetical protein VGE38_16600 [Nocardioides sp.]|uniref:hypothetical protein n=1 Tax=Nocardioides sp. TaxID=35761 RepID=UPI002EDAFE8C